MNTLNIKLPYSYIIDYIDLDWHVLLFAVENGFVEKESVLRYAESQIETEANPSQLLLDLAWEKDENSVYEYLIKLANLSSPKDEENLKEKFLFLLLNWIFENREKYGDPLEMVEIIYADFDYPEEISGFVKYMPPQYPLHSSKPENVKQLYENWEKFCEKKKKENKKS